ncbi:MAG: N-formylglutamate amidohydrolase [Candidatus Hodarchaeota archaeon]
MKRYFEIVMGTEPIILSCAHGGFKKPKRIPDKLMGPQIPDENTYFIAKQIIHELKKQNICIFYIFNKIHRSKIDLNRSARSEMAFNQSSNEARNIHHAYHEQLIKFTQMCVSIYDRCLIIDFHGFSKPEKDYPDIVFGHLYGNTLSLFQDSDKEGFDKYWGFFHLDQEISRNFSLDNGLDLTNYNLSYSGGHITQQFYNKEKINAIQIEVSKEIRVNSERRKVFINIFIKAILQTLSDY